MSWQETWKESPRVIPLEDGARGEGFRRGRVGIAFFPAGFYPACSLHGALSALGGVGSMKWRCMVEGCNAGAETERPWSEWGFKEPDRDGFLDLMRLTGAARVETLKNELGRLREAIREHHAQVLLGARDDHDADEALWRAGEGA